MIPKVNSVSSIYIYKSNLKSWKNSGNHGVYCLAYQVSGYYDHKFPTENLTVKSDTLFFITKYTPYSVSCVEQGEAMCVTFTADIDLPASVFDCKEHPEIKVLFQKLMNYKNLLSSSNHCEAMAIIYKLLSFIYKQSSPEYIEHTNRDKIRLAYNYIAENYTNPSLQTGEIAESYGISTKYFRTLFKKVYNTTPSQCLISIRLQAAVKLLTESNLSIGDIAQMSGFSDVYYFSKLFKEKFGCPPSEYRNRSDSFTILP